jgi:hypothetical protein
MNHLRARAAHLLRTEGVRGLVTGAAGHVNEVRRSVLCAERYVIYQFDTDTGCGPLRAPRVDGLEVFVVEREEDLHALAARGFEVPVSHPTLRRGWLRCGGVAFCAYVERELAHVAWVALGDAARGCCDGLPYHVDFEHGEACWGGSYTSRRFRGRGLYTYVCGVRLRYLHEHGWSVCRDAVRVDNVASLKGQGWWNPRPCFGASLVRFFRWTRWREYPCR